ncbi:MAG: hypothetical protein J0I32_04740 [Sphingobacteriales bacterium]|nr:hypothetical protein [Sphingobacteriales bacterium]OJV98467.1 MAG: hypothetical protein BGO52_11820 [Sphingobacteriales bacterium 44-61]
MQNYSLQVISAFHEEFGRLDYQGKVVWFDKEFGIVPFEFPSFDIEATWFSNELKLSNLIMMFHQDSRESNFFEKKIKLKEQSFKFDIRPLSKLQRIFLNQYIINKFLEGRNNLNEQITQEYTNSANKFKFLEARVYKLATVINWVNHTFDSHTKVALRLQFLRIFHNGFLAFTHGNDKMITIRRNFVELFLYSQGLLLAEHWADIQKKLEKTLPKKSDRKNLSLPLKIVLLKELGIIELLKAKFKENRVDGFHNSLADLICLITSESPKNHQSIVEFITALSTGTSSDLLTVENIRMIKNKLEQFQLS